MCFVFVMCQCREDMMSIHVARATAPESTSLATDQHSEGFDTQWVLLKMEINLYRF